MAAVTSTRVPLENSMSTHQTRSISPLTQNELDKLEGAFQDPVFRQLLCDYANEVQHPSSKAKYEADIAKLEAENGVKCTFLHPLPGFVIKTKDMSSKGTKVFINVCFDEQVGQPENWEDMEKGRTGFRWSLPYVQSRPHQERDKAGKSCWVYDVIFNSIAQEMAEGNLGFRGILKDTAFDAVEEAFKIHLDRCNAKFPRLKYKGSFRSTVIRKPISKGTDVKTVSALPQKPHRKTPRNFINYKNEMSLFGGSDSCRPTSLVVTIELPGLSSAKGVVLDVVEQRLTLDSEPPEAYYMELKLPFPVDEDGGSATFDKSIGSLVVTLPVKPAASVRNGTPVSRLFSTDSGIGLDLEDCPPNDVIDKPSSHVGDEAQDENDAILPPYTCNIYEDLMVFKMDVKNVDADSVKKEEVFLYDGNEVGFKLTFSNVGDGMVAANYKFLMVFVVDELKFGNRDDVSVEKGNILDNLEIEVWDNNVIVQLSTPELAEFKKYKVGSVVDQMVEHQLPSLRTFRRKREELKETAGAKNVVVAKTLADDDRECHVSGGSVDSAFSVSLIPPSEPLSMPEVVDKAVFSDAGSKSEIQSSNKKEAKRGILKRCVRRCLSESQADNMRFDTGDECTSGCDSTAEGECTNVGGFCKKTVRFNEVVQRQVFKASASILGQKHKNQKKSEQKIRRKQAMLSNNSQRASKIERRASEGDAVEMMAADGFKTCASFSSSLNPNVTTEVYVDEPADCHFQGGDDDSQHDSGIASSYEDQLQQQQKSSGCLREKIPSSVGPENSRENGGSRRRANARGRKGKRKLGNGRDDGFLKCSQSDLIFALDF